MSSVFAHSRFSVSGQNPGSRRSSRGKIGMLRDKNSQFLMTPTHPRAGVITSSGGTPERMSETMACTHLQAARGNTAARESPASHLSIAASRRSGANLRAGTRSRIRG
ncbi:hypothetical protein Y032_0228g2850 [Ancylostoma ceylanicum]|uniref:Uncharacterized protein n=1 Tax=Ancylostoma ceylanicum TaxID=53326 RepID=A0A016SH17_9BILA|nr:hypothetical protein Y032_0228g2850 [Ancylostoma ceylanicum]